VQNTSEAVVAKNGAKHGRRKLAKNLPRRRVVHELSKEELGCPECGAERTAIGEEVSERYGYIPSCVEVIEDVRLKYACSTCQEHVVIAAVPNKPIPKGLADSSMLAYIATSKFADHLRVGTLTTVMGLSSREMCRRICRTRGQFVQSHSVCKHQHSAMCNLVCRLYVDPFSVYMIRPVAERDKQLGYLRQRGFVNRFPFLYIVDAEQVDKRVRDTTHVRPQPFNV
jgi:transposase